MFDRSFRLHLSTQHNLGRAQINAISMVAAADDYADEIQGPQAKRQRFNIPVIPHQQAGHNHNVNDGQVASPSNIPPSRQQQQDQDIDNAVAGPSNAPEPQPRQQFRCNLCDKTFRTSHNLMVHIDMHTRIEARRHPQVHPGILQNHLNENIEANCKICNQSVALNKMADHMIETHIPRNDCPDDTFIPHGDQSSIQAAASHQQGLGTTPGDNAVAGPSNARQPQPETHATVDAQQVLRDLHLEDIDFDEEFIVS